MVGFKQYNSLLAYATMLKYKLKPWDHKSMILVHRPFINLPSIYFSMGKENIWKCNNQVIFHFKWRRFSNLIHFLQSWKESRVNRWCGNFHFVRSNLLFLTELSKDVLISLVLSPSKLKTYATRTELNYLLGRGTNYEWLYYAGNYVLNNNNFWQSRFERCFGPVEGWKTVSWRFASC